MYTRLHTKYLLFLYDFNETWISSTEFRKILNIQNFKNIRPVVVELFHADRRTWYSSAPSSGPPGGISKHASYSKWCSSRYWKIISTWNRPWRPRGAEIYLCSCFNSWLDGSGWLTPRPGRCTPGWPGTHGIGGWVGPRIGPNWCRKISPPQRDSIPGPSSL